MSALPIIDISPIQNGNPEEIQVVADQLGHAAREIGFFYVENHGIPLTVIEEAYQMAEMFFGQSEAFKRSYYIGDSKNHRGYVPFTEKGDYADEVHRNYEAFDLALELPSNDPDYLQGNLLLGPNVWPDLFEFQTKIYGYYQAVAKTGRLIIGALEHHLGLRAETLTNQMTKPISQLRLIHYVRPQVEIPSDTVNMGAHTDYECLTLLHQRQGGLQVMTRDDKWIDVPVRPEAFVVNIGDMLEAWTNGIFRSTPHRVLNLSPERYSMPYFVAANYDTPIKPFDQFVPAGEQPNYQPFTAGLHLERMLRRDFPYLRARANEDLALSADVLVDNPFEDRINPN